MIRPNDLARMLASDAHTIQKLKTDPSIPMETIPPLTDMQETLLSHPKIPESAHARDHFFSYNDEIVGLVKDVLENYQGEADTVLATKIGHSIDESRMVEYGSNKIRFTGVVPVGSRIRGRYKLLDVKDVDAKTQLLTWGVTGEIEGGTKPILIAESLSRRSS